jgi:Uma2 family endonuclease
LGWLIDLETQKVEIYRPNQDVEVFESPVLLSEETVLPGFILNLDSIW